jgi:DNA repair protein RecN (Recombination protein N)
VLRSLYIKNYALIEEFTVTFERGLNIITGETGAGKSIVLGAFGLLIGERAASDLIRAGADKAIVEAEFDIAGNPSLRKFFEEKEIDCPGDSLIIRREVTQRGTSRGFVNDSPASTSLLKSLGDYLVDLHGQHEHQSLLHAQRHIVMLDDFASLGQVVSEYQALRTHLQQLVSEISELRAREAKLREEHDLYEFQLREILSVDPAPDEDARIEQELRVLENAEELRSGAQEIHDALYVADGSAYEKLGEVKEQLARLRTFDASLEEPLKEAQSALAIVSELSNWIGRYAERVELDPERLASLRQRAQGIQRLKKKFGGTLEAVLTRKSELESKLSFEEEFEEMISKKQSELQKRSGELAVIAEKLSKARTKAARKLEPQIVAVLKDLGIESSKFEVQIRQTEAKEGDRIPLDISGRKLAANARGVDEIEFYISTNAGEKPKPLARVASGGEISRIMLALKTILAKNDKLPLLVFDEIDIGISGRVAQRVGRAMKALAGDHQIIAITHLAQIAAFAQAHYQAEKRTVKGSTTSLLQRLTDAEHAEEVARLISGAEVSDSSLKNARALIEEAMGQAA